MPLWTTTKIIVGQLCIRFLYGRAYWYDGGIGDEVLSAENLEPVKGIQVGLHKNLGQCIREASVRPYFTLLTARGILPFAGFTPWEITAFMPLMDGNQNYLFDWRWGRLLSWIHVGSADMRPDVLPSGYRMEQVGYIGLWYDLRGFYTRFFADNLILRCSRKRIRCSIWWRASVKVGTVFLCISVPKRDYASYHQGIGFWWEGCIYHRSNPRNDTIRYWIKDTVMCERDTLTFQMDYLATDTLGQLVPKTDTLRMVNKIDKKRRMALAEEAMKKEEKERKNVKRKVIHWRWNRNSLVMSVDAPSSLDLNRNIALKFEEPVEHWHTAAIHMAVKVDSVVGGYTVYSDGRLRGSPSVSDSGRLATDRSISSK